MARILIVEDNRLNMKQLVLLLESAGHTVLCAPDAESGIQLARSGQPDLILMDIQLPGMNGLAATALLKKDPATAAIPVIAVTAMVMRNDRVKAVEAGCDGYVAKPYLAAELYSVMDTFLLKRGPQADIAES